MNNLYSGKIKCQHIVLEYQYRHMKKKDDPVPELL